MDLYVIAKFGFWSSLSLISTLLCFSGISKVSPIFSDIKKTKNYSDNEKFKDRIINFTKTPKFGIALLFFGLGVLFIEGTPFNLLIVALAIFTLIGIKISSSSDENCECFGSWAGKRATLAAQVTLFLACISVLTLGAPLAAAPSSFPFIVHLGLFISSITICFIIFTPSMIKHFRKSKNTNDPDHMHVPNIAQDQFLGFDNEASRDLAWALKIGKPIFLIFSKSTCPACESFLDSFNQTIEDNSHHFTFILISDKTHVYKRFYDLKVLQDADHLFLKSISNEFFPSALCINNNSGLPLTPVCQGVDRINLLFRLALGAI
ncbi:hypothetical protein [Cellvibrio sp. PSBB023]|uniref:hypothetical protein n=1 Tax=Cellvibrio sp. PSBB023 TaxID=1945512 RepID=UPI00098F3985|nr:hypothetical protein [Cellvibrio sp. PSBB023]AQT60515.1 hypothetical protein B0D95_10760 [Cellvibrio sp. PSBB023]